MKQTRETRAATQITRQSGLEGSCQVKRVCVSPSLHIRHEISLKSYLEADLRAVTTRPCHSIAPVGALELSSLQNVKYLNLPKKLSGLN